MTEGTPLMNKGLPKMISGLPATVEWQDKVLPSKDESVEDEH